jgi:hypothetical protein
LVLVREATVTQGMNDRLIETGRYYAKEKSVEKRRYVDYDRSQTTEECGIFQLFG